MLIHELYGIQAEQLENLRLEYGKLLGLVRMISAGEVDPNNVTVSDNCWTIEESSGS